MTAYRVIGIDPSLTATGLAVVESERNGDYVVSEHVTLKTESTVPILDRLWFLKAGVERFLEEHRWTPRIGTSAIIVEDPTSRSGPAARATRGKDPRTILLMGLAVGIVLEPVLQQRTLGGHVEFITPDEWMPKKLTGNLSHIMAHHEILAFLRERVQFPERVSEHVVFAGGLARYWTEQQRLKARMAG